MPSARDFECPICMVLMIQPVMLPCRHELCLKCFETNFTQMSVLCPLCRTRIATWARKAIKNKRLVNEAKWQQIQRLFPEKVKNILEGREVVSDEEEAPVQVLCESGALGKEYYEELKKIEDERERAKCEEESASAQLIAQLQREDDENLKNARIYRQADFVSHGNAIGSAIPSSMALSDLSYLSPVEIRRLKEIKEEEEASLRLIEQLQREDEEWEQQQRILIEQKKMMDTCSTQQPIKITSDRTTTQSTSSSQGSIPASSRGSLSASSQGSIPASSSSASVASSSVGLPPSSSSGLGPSQSVIYVAEDEPTTFASSSSNHLQNHPSFGRSASERNKANVDKYQSLTSWLNKSKSIPAAIGSDPETGAGVIEMARGQQPGTSVTVERPGTSTNQDTTSAVSAIQGQPGTSLVQGHSAPSTSQEQRGTRPIQDPPADLRLPSGSSNDLETISAPRANAAEHVPTNLTVPAVMVPSVAGAVTKAAVPTVTVPSVAVTVTKAAVPTVTVPGVAVSTEANKNLVVPDSLTGSTLSGRAQNFDEIMNEVFNNVLNVDFPLTSSISGTAPSAPETTADVNLVTVEDASGTVSRTRPKVPIKPKVPAVDAACGGGTLSTSQGKRKAGAGNAARGRVTKRACTRDVAVDDALPGNDVAVAPTAKMRKNWTLVTARDCEEHCRRLLLRSSVGMGPGLSENVDIPGRFQPFSFWSGETGIPGKKKPASATSESIFSDVVASVDDDLLPSASVDEAPRSRDDFASEAEWVGYVKAREDCDFQVALRLQTLFDEESRRLASPANVRHDEGGYFLRKSSRNSSPAAGCSSERR